MSNKQDILTIRGNAERPESQGLRVLQQSRAANSQVMYWGEIVEGLGTDDSFVGAFYVINDELATEGSPLARVDIKCPLEAVAYVEIGKRFAACKRTADNRWYAVGIYEKETWSSDYWSSMEEPSSEELSSDHWSSAEEPSSQEISSDFWSSAEEPSSAEISSGYWSSAEEPSSAELSSDLASSDYWSSAEEPSSDEISSDYWSSAEEPSSDYWSSGEEPSSDQPSSHDPIWPSSDSPSSDEPSSDYPSSDWPSSGYISSANSSELSSDEPSSDELSSDAPSSDAVTSDDWYDCTPGTLTIEFEGIERCGDTEFFNAPPAEALNGIHVITKSSGCSYFADIWIDGYNYSFKVFITLDNSNGTFYVRVFPGTVDEYCAFYFTNGGEPVRRGRAYDNLNACSNTYRQLGHNGKAYIY